MQKVQPRHKLFVLTAYWLIQIVGWWTWSLAPIDSSPFFQPWIGLTAALVIWSLIWFKTHTFLARLGLFSVIAMYALRIYMPSQ